MFWRSALPELNSFTHVVECVKKILTALSVSLFSLHCFFTYSFFSCPCGWWCCSTVAGLRYCGRWREIHGISPLWIALLREKKQTVWHFWHWHLQEATEIKADVGSFYTAGWSLPKGQKWCSQSKLCFYCFSH